MRWGIGWNFYDVLFGLAINASIIIWILPNCNNWQVLMDFCLLWNDCWMKLLSIIQVKLSWLYQKSRGWNYSMEIKKTLSFFVTWVISSGSFITCWLSKCGLCLDFSLIIYMVPICYIMMVASGKLQSNNSKIIEFL